MGEPMRQRAVAAFSALLLLVLVVDPLPATAVGTPTVDALPDGVGPLIVVEQGSGRGGAATDRRRGRGRDQVAAGGPGREGRATRSRQVEGTRGAGSPRSRRPRRGSTPKGGAGEGGSGRSRARRRDRRRRSQVGAPTSRGRRDTRRRGASAGQSRRSRCCGEGESLPGVPGPGCGRRRRGPRLVDHPRRRRRRSLPRR